jgi:N-acetylglucosamine-6-phosphate deacetylase
MRLGGKEIMPLGSVAIPGVTMFHSHGIAGVDFSRLKPHDLRLINDIASERGIFLCPTVFLCREGLGNFITLMSAYSEQASEGTLANIIGFSLEGPLLGDQGGTPKGARWTPTTSEWRDIAALASAGLRYLVIAPDAFDLDDTIAPTYSFRGLLCDCYDAGLRIALGHFAARQDPRSSAARVTAVLDFLHKRYESSPFLALTDHMFNDMPRNFLHAWRTRRERRRRTQELSAFLAVPWEPETLPELLGPVPAVLLHAAREGLLTPALNFDGFHVDLQICKRTVDYLGSSRLIAMTDDTDATTLSGEILYRKRDSPLQYRRDGVVAAGSSDYPTQVANMLRIGLSAEDIALMFGSVPNAALRFAPKRRRPPSQAASL